MWILTRSSHERAAQFKVIKLRATRRKKNDTKTKAGWIDIVSQWASSKRVWSLTSCKARCSPFSRTFVQHIDTFMLCGELLIEIWYSSSFRSGMAQLRNWARYCTNTRCLPFVENFPTLYVFDFSRAGSKLKMFSVLKRNAAVLYELVIACSFLLFVLETKINRRIQKWFHV